MFKITRLIMYGTDGNEFTYKFKSGINYFKGKNSSGKTEFYGFIDFMFGSSEDIRKKPWYTDSLEKATLIFEYNSIEYSISRTRNPELNYLNYSDEVESMGINFREYKEKLNAIFVKDINQLKEIRRFTEEELTYRSFTMFNFLGEKRQGAIHDFFDKCSDVRYSIKLAPILNFIFNKNLGRIHELKEELNNLLEEIRVLEDNFAKYEFIYNRVNSNLQKLGLNIWYNGKNVDEIKQKIDEMKAMHVIFKKKNEKNVADLEVMYNNISEQIKIYENSIADSRQFEKDNKNRILLLTKLEGLLDENNTFDYLVSPLKNLVTELESTISFSKYVISDNTVKELKKQREILKAKIKSNDARFKLFTLEEKSKAIVLIEDCLSTSIQSPAEELKTKRKKIKEIKDELKILQNSDNSQKIKELSQYITKLYESAKDISSVVNDDLERDGFKIQYLKKGNILQPMVVEPISEENKTEERKIVNYYIGSMARHTLIQLCGYLGFLKMLLKEDIYPLIPILVIDHISKPFDQNNSKAIGKIITTAYESIGKDRLQLFIFDNEEYENLAINPDHSENLVNESKTGFNPFYVPPLAKTEFENINDVNDD
ncbi:hypothetical protein [Paenibacillus sp. IHB B 3084]|uniref:hypothetical protein n=1 Tax=Paenibacillus sp. IHB B 3084 TaxID=867076 RepID=UPI000ACC1B6B|nr:hypothetical protein [Paenibacillus sp. IHB B 3084]